jgi:hypothetical protein
LQNTVDISNTELDNDAVIFRLLLVGLALAEAQHVTRLGNTYASYKVEGVWEVMIH